MAQLKTIPFTSEVPVKSCGVYDLTGGILVDQGDVDVSNGSLTTRGDITTSGGLVFGSGGHIKANGNDATVYLEAGSYVYFSGAGISVSDRSLPTNDGVYINPDGRIIACGKIKSSTSGVFNGGITAGGAANITGGIQNSGALLTKGNATFRGTVDAEGQTVKTGNIEVRGAGGQYVKGYVPFSASSHDVGAPSTWAGSISTSYADGSFSAHVSISNTTDCCFVDNGSGSSDLNFSGWSPLASEDQPAPQEYYLYSDTGRSFGVKCLTLTGEPVEGVPVGYWENHTAGAEGSGQIFGYIDGGINLDTRFLLWRGRRIYIDSNNFLKIV